MWPVVPLSLVVSAVGGITFLVLFATRLVQPEWWRSRAVRIGSFGVFGLMSLGIALWIIGGIFEDHAIVYRGSSIAQGGVIVLLPAALMMPGAALLHRVFSTKRRSTRTAATAAPEEEKLTRRSLLRFGSASLPAVAAMGAVGGLAQARCAPTLPVIRLRWPGLHPDLHGLRILQLSDVHLGASLGLDDLERGLDLACERHRPDLIVLTGDLADYPDFIPHALRLVANKKPRHGVFASLGNHEYLHDIAITRPLYDGSPVPLLVSAGLSIPIGRATLFIAGADDPVQMNGDLPALLRPSIEAALASAPASADFRLLLCHRPEGHGPAAENGVDLTLSGHTHGGQLGLFGRSVFERLRPGIGWWGAYSKARPPAIARERELGSSRGPRGPSRLYTTSGTGHWLPFRIGCPTEIPLIVLEAEEATRTGAGV